MLYTVHLALEPYRDTARHHSSPRLLDSCFALSFELPPPNKLLSQDIPGIDTEPAGGYSLPLTVTLGVHVHHWSSGTPLRAEGMCWPQPRQVAFASWLLAYELLNGVGVLGSNLQQVEQVTPKHMLKDGGKLEVEML